MKLICFKHRSPYPSFVFSIIGVSILIIISFIFCPFIQKYGFKIISSLFLILTSIFSISLLVKVVSNDLISKGLKYIYDLFHIRYDVQKPLMFSPEQFEKAFVELIEQVKDKKIVIIIDNIDRCYKELAYELFTNVKNFLGNDQSVVFVIPVDDSALKQFFINYNKTNINCDKEADEFLRKFFNVTIRIKPFQCEEIYEFASNPRRIIQFFNNLSTELECFDIEFSEKYQGVICKMLIIREEFPDFYNETIKSPEIIFQHYSSDNNKKLEIFLNNTYAITMLLKNDISILERIISNSNVFDGISTTVKESIQKSDIEALKLYISENESSKNKVIIYMLSLLQKAIKRENYKIDVRNYFNILLGLFENGTLTNYDHKRIYDLIKADNVLDGIIENLETYDSILKFSKKLKEYGLSNLVERIIATLNNLPDAKKDQFGDLIDEDRFFSEKQLRGIYYACELYNKNTVLRLRDIFKRVYKKDNESLFKNYNFGDKYNILFEKDTIKYIVEHLDLSNSEDAWLSDFIFISEKQNYPSFALAEYLSKSANEFPAYDYSRDNSSDILPKLAQINFVLEGYSSKKPNYNSAGIFLIKNLLNSIGLNLSKETQVVEHRNYNSINISKSLINDNIGSSFILLKDVLFNDEKERIAKLEEILNLAIDEETNEECKSKFIHLIEDVIKNEVCKSSIAVIISQKSKDEILKLSKPIQTLAIDVFSDNQSDYESNVEVLKLIASNGNSNQIEKLVPLVNRMINDEAKRSSALSLVLSFNKLSEEQADALKSSLKLFGKEEEFKEQIEGCKKHIKKISIK